MSDPNVSARRSHVYVKKEFEIPGRENRKQDPNSLFATEWPKRSDRQSISAPAPKAVEATFAMPQTLGLAFDGISGPRDTDAVPPDSMGAVGPTQFFLFVNGALVTFNKTTGQKDFVIYANPDTFFQSVMTSAPINFTSDPQIRYDRLTKRWILAIIDVPSSSNNSIGDKPNRLLLAVSDAASRGRDHSGDGLDILFRPTKHVRRGEYRRVPGLRISRGR